MQFHHAARGMPPSNSEAYLANLATYARRNVERWEKKKDAGEVGAAQGFRRAVEVLGAVLQQSQPSWAFYLPMLRFFLSQVLGDASLEAYHSDLKLWFDECREFKRKSETKGADVTWCSPSRTFAER